MSLESFQSSHLYHIVAFQRDGIVQLFRTKGHAQNLAKGQDRPGQPVKIQDGGMWDGTIQDFDNLSRPVLRDKTRQSRKGHSKTGRGCSKNRKRRFKTGKDVLKQ